EDPMPSASDQLWESANATVDVTPFWKRHLRAQLRLYSWTTAQGEGDERYRTAVVWGLTTFLHGLQDCLDITSLRERAQDTSWWDWLCRRELDCPSLLQLRIRGVPVSGHGLAGAALALRYLELTRRLVVDPTIVLKAPPRSILDWLAEP